MSYIRFCQEEESSERNTKGRKLVSLIIYIKELRFAISSMKTQLLQT